MNGIIIFLFLYCIVPGVNPNRWELRWTGGSKEQGGCCRVHRSVASAVMKQVESGKVRGGSCNLGGRLLYYPTVLSWGQRTYTHTREIRAEGGKMRGKGENKSKCVRFRTGERAGEEGEAISRLVLITFPSLCFFPPFHWSPAPSSTFGRVTLPKLFHKHFGLQPPAKEECKGMMYKALIRPNYESWLRLLISRASTSAGEGGSDGEDSGREREKEGGGEGRREGGREGDFGGKCMSRREGRCKERKCKRARIYVVTLSDVLLNTDVCCWKAADI